MRRFFDWISSSLRAGSDYSGPIGATTKRSTKWEGCRKEKLKSSPTCVACSTSKQLEVHHVIPYHISPEMELMESNLITLCRECHFTFGHLKDWLSWNTAVRVDCTRFASQRESRP